MAVEKLKVLDLFSGIGGFSIGLERTGGFETVAFCEIEEFPRRVLAKHWPKVPCYHDVKQLTANTLARDGIAVDVITGGFPCQDLSVAGKQIGIEGPRSGLWRELVRLIGEIRPSFAVLENVTGLLNRGLDVVLGALAQIGYDAEWHCIRACRFGLPHIRDRIWIIAYPAGQRWAGVLRDIFQFGIEPPKEGAAIALDTQNFFDAGQCGRQGLGEPPFFRGNDGVSNRVDRLKSIGNAVVPQIPELIGRAILDAQKGLAIGN
jgi:DNA (cytosine-5)-methyltransferase 1